MKTSKWIVLLVAIVVGALAVGRLRRLAPVPRDPGNIASLGSIRSALSIYYGDSEGNYPATLDALVPRYLKEIPAVQDLDAHPPTRSVALSDDLKFTDSGGWLYVADPRSKRFGEVRIDCTHRIGGKSWSEY